MGLFEFLSGDTAAGTAKAVVGTVFDGVDKLIRDFKIPPEQLVEYEKFKTDQLGKVEAIDAADRNSARQREMAVHDSTPKNLAYLSLLIFSGLAAAVVFNDIPPTSHDIVIAMLSWVGGFVSSAFLYYFGSSSSSRSKDLTIHTLSQGNNQPKP